VPTLSPLQPASPYLVIDSAFTAFNPAIHRAASAALAAVKQWTKDAYSGDGRGLVLWANVQGIPGGVGWGYGNGKTLLARCAANALYATLTISTPGGEIPDRTGVFLTTEQFKDAIMQSYDSHSTSDYLRQFRQARFVIMDDFGVEHVRPDSLGWWQEQLYKLTNYAYDAHQPFLLTSNMTPDEMQARMGGKNWSRLFGMCQERGFINVSEIPDQRRKPR